MENKMGGDNMAGSIPKDGDPSHDFREPVNPDAKGAVMGAKVLRQDANFVESTYDGQGKGKSAAL